MYNFTWTPDMFMELLLGIVIFVVLLMLARTFIRYFKHRVKPLTRDELKTEKKRLNKLLKTDHNAAIIKLADVRYDPILQELAKKHKRDKQLVDLSKKSLKVRKDNYGIFATLAKYGNTDPDEAKTARFLTSRVTRTQTRTSTMTPTRPPPPPAAQPTIPTTGHGLTFNIDGSKVYVFHRFNHDTYDIFDLSTAFDEATATYAGTITGEDLRDMKSNERNTLNETMSTVAVTVGIPFTDRAALRQNEIERLKILAGCKPVPPAGRKLHG